ncbi:hypothetical protein EVG20_g5487 [Dentipellis fragilis]|uniref:Uncharacterized protein n=1 Tax=Dentipellis fragilis TaxID=205917 RepID=A0A4Y9YVJ1_9AGAM|nr:hypothetical protein EVG20_g5487 [Dentipellis fragilis]
MASIYAKSLKRCDFSGIVDTDKVKASIDNKNPKADDAKADLPKAGADIGKIVKTGGCNHQRGSASSCPHAHTRNAARAPCVFLCPPAERAQPPTTAT